MRKTLKTGLILLCITALVGCGAKGNGSTASDEASASDYKSSVEILEAAWNGMPEGEKFYAYGGDIENSVENAPGTLSKVDSDVLTYSLYVPEELHASVSDVSTLIHGLNANMFTSAAMKVPAASQADFISKLKDSLLHAQFICGFPDKLVIYTTGDYVFYAFGATENIALFTDSVNANVKNAKLEADEAFDI